MKYFRGLFLLLGVLIFASCIKHEVIPPPDKRAELPVSFSAVIDGNNYELIKDIDGYYCSPSQAREILPAPQMSNVIYFSDIKSDEALDFVQIAFGRLEYDATEHAIPTKGKFEDFFKNQDNQEPDYSLGGVNGVQIVYRDGNGDVWMSSEDAGDPQNFELTSVALESDDKGDYITFVAKFNVTLYDDIDEPEESIRLDNALFQGYFQREN